MNPQGKKEVVSKQLPKEIDCNALPVESPSLLDKLLRLAIIDACEEIIRLSKRPGKRDGAMILDLAEARLFNIWNASCLAGDQDRPKSINICVEQAMDHICAHFNGGEPRAVTGIGTGFDDLDKITSGFHPGEVVLLASRPGMGRLALAIGMVNHIAMALGHPVLILSLDFPAVQVAVAFLSSRSKIAFWKLQHGQLSAQEMENLAIEAGILSDSRVVIVDGLIRRLSDLRAQTRRAHRKSNGLGLIVIDSLQRLSETICTEESKISMDALLRTLKTLAKEMSVPILVLSELSGDLEDRDDKRPMLIDLHSIGVNDHYADAVLMLYRDEHYQPDSDNKDAAEVHVLRNHQGPTGVAFLRAHLECFRFESVR